MIHLACLGSGIGGGIYLFVFVWFVIVVTLLALFSRWFA